MGCEFGIAFPAATRHALDAGFAALDEIERLEARLSVFQEESEISRLNRSEGEMQVSPEVFELLRRAAALARSTGGAFDPACGALVRAWAARRVPSAELRAAAREASGIAHIKLGDGGRTVTFLDSGVEFNLGAIGKGYAIDRALALAVRRYRVRAALMQGGRSSLKAIGAPPAEPRGWPVVLGDPLCPGRALATIWLRDHALATSAADHQFFVENGRRYGHILDPRTGWPAEGVLSASVVARHASDADALSTAFFVLGEEGVRRFCLAHREIGTVLVVPGKMVIIGNVDAEVNS
jgi:FAD:protein FMN transferase